MSRARMLMPVPPAVAPPRCVALSGQDDLARMTPPLDRVLCDDFDLAGLAGKLCPARREDGSAVIFAVQDEARSDAAWELARQLQQRGYRLADPVCVILPATLLLALASRRVRSDTLNSRRQVLADPQRSALSHAFAEIVAWGVRAHASDIHLNVRTRHAESQVRYTVAGRYVSPDCYARMPTATLREILSVAWMEVQGGNGSVFDPAIEQQGRIWHQAAGRHVMLRWASLATDAGPSVCLRIVRLDDTVATADLAGLGYLPGQVDILARACRVEGGAVVLAGVVGSGKSTTLAGMMRTIPETRKVITLEDPVEYLIPGALQNTVGRDLETPEATVFDAKLRTLKRSAMNDLMIGEIRDVQTGRAFMDLAGSGVSVYTTTHAGSAVLVAERLASDFIGIARDFLATPGVLKLLGYQALLPALCQACALPLDSLGADRRDTRDWRGWVGGIESAYGVDCAGMRVRNPAGCPQCAPGQLPGLAGTRGRTVVAEFVEPDADPECLRLIRARDNLGLARHVAASRRAAFDSPDMSGKSAMACGLYKALQGWVDPRDVEARFRPFDHVPAWERGR
ncbi:putative general secretion pathway protein [plant metagenome]|uniref:Putative general secretion pathway protein n=1 Tax=plant metagenome TaxID=1297885 RepID=A0A484SCN0_9ZZZZ